MLFSFRGQATHASAVSLARTLGVMIRTLLFSTAVSLALSTSSIASLTGEPNAAFDEQFIWAIAAELATNLSSSLNLKERGLESEFVSDQEKFFEILYFNELISCATPLASLAPGLAGVKLSRSDNTIGVASQEIRRALQDHHKMIQTEIYAWDRSARERIVSTYLANQWSVSPPKCIHPQALYQIPALRPAHK